MLIKPTLGNLPIRYKILAACLAVIIPFALTIGGLAYSHMQRALEAHIESELSNTTATIRNMVATSVRLSIRGYLRSVAETNLKLVRQLHERVKRGELTLADAKARAADLILSQKIGASGYLYVVTSDGTAVIHPDPKVQGVNFRTTGFVIEQMRRKNGYIEYEWQNPGEPGPRGKALSMSYFEPWDWIISASSYRAEFGELVDVEDFKANIGALKFGRSGYSYILDLKGNLVIHPIYMGKNAFDIGEGDKDFVREMIATRLGHKTYLWKNPGESAPREKLVVYDFVPEVDWIVASSAYLDDLYAPLREFRDQSFLMIGFFALAGIVLAFSISATITRPVSRLVERLGRGGPNEPPLSGDEIENLSALFDRYLERLELETKERRIAETNYRQSQERYRAVMEAAPDPVMVLDPAGAVVYINRAFTSLFKYQQGDFGEKFWETFVHRDVKERASIIARRLFKGETISGAEAVIVAKDGEERFVSLSGGPYHDGADRFAGCVVIYRDITEFKKMEREVINADEHERIRIGQDLHDDLAPHLIGIDVMCQVLKKKLAAENSPASTDAANIQALVVEATRKTRALARGLSPVHLAEEGLEMGLTQLLEMVELIFGVACELNWEGAAHLDATTSVHLYRIVQEALHNAIKHANADRIEVHCVAGEEMITITVADDGVGLGQKKHEQRGMGIKIMAFRARMIGGILHFGSPEEGGTTVTITLRNESKTTSAGRGLGPLITERQEA